jgi:hypothetical protein
MYNNPNKDAGNPNVDPSLLSGEIIIMNIPTNTIIPVPIKAKIAKKVAHLAVVVK